MTPKYLSQMVPSISMNIHQLIQLWKEKVRVLGDQGGSCFESIGDFRSCTMVSTRGVVDASTLVANNRS